MPDELLIRFAWTLAIIAGGVLLYRLVSHLLVSRAQAKVRLLVQARRGTPAIVYFTSPDCAPCRTMQRPALLSVQNRLGDAVQVIEINTYEQPDLAKEWGVLSLPTTFIIDANGKPRHVNHGVTPAGKLIEQVDKFIS
jgi:thioredoxin-like negative regulator of GroEL